MNTIFFRKSVFGMLTLTTVAILATALSVKAQTPASTNTQQFIDPSHFVVSENQMNTGTEQFSVQNSAKVEMPAQNVSAKKVEQKYRVANITQTSQQFPSATTKTATRVITPVPGTIGTSSVQLNQKYPTSDLRNSSTKVAQSDINIGTPTRGSSSYIGIAGNIGITGGQSSLGDGNFAVISKIGLTNTLSARPSAVFGDSTAILIPVTYDFKPLQTSDPFSEPLAISPYIGAGAAIDTGKHSQVAFLLTGGVDVPLNRQFTATAAVNAGFFDQTDVGLMLGVGYNFNGL